MLTQIPGGMAWFPASSVKGAVWKIPRRPIL